MTVTTSLVRVQTMVAAVQSVDRRRGVDRVLFAQPKCWTGVVRWTWSGKGDQVVLME